MTEAKSGRVILVAVDNSENSEWALDWVLGNMYREGDDLRLLHVIPLAIEGLPIVIDMGVPAYPQADPNQDHEHLAAAKAFIQERFGTKLDAKSIPYTMVLVHFQTDRDSIGEAICRRAEATKAFAVVMSKHQRGRIPEFFLGSVTNYCTTHCKAPLVILHH